MSINIYIAPIASGVKLIVDLLVQEFQFSPVHTASVQDLVTPHLDKLKDSCYLLAETSYADRVYRNSYYNYYSSKLTSYKRECIRISFFDGEIKQGDFRDAAKTDYLQERYLGFIILRPTEPFVIGRSVLSPKALKIGEFSCCTTKFDVTANSVKLSVSGFPHSSQDTETISCAETSLWAIMEYFSSHYQDYKPQLPSQIVSTLAKLSAERQIPSKGLDISQMSFALKEFGFGTCIYGRSQYNDEFEKILSTYIDSGIPLLIALDNNLPSGRIGHALICIGHHQADSSQIDALPVNDIADNNLKAITSAKNIAIHDYSSIKREFVFVDDNFPVYQFASLHNPAAHYNDLAWQACRITHFIVPLYPKIYLEAFEAKNYVLRFLVTGPEPIAVDSELLLRFYLASSRSYKHALALNDSFQEDLKDILLETSMPKFIWVAELSSKDMIKDSPQKANGIIILDATEANIYYNKPSIIAAYDNKLIFTNEKTSILESNVLTLRPFSIYLNNLKHF